MVEDDDSERFCGAVVVVTPSEQLSHAPKFHVDDKELPLGRSVCLEGYLDTAISV